jgi:hypothetical protein
MSRPSLVAAKAVTPRSMHKVTLRSGEASTSAPLVWMLAYQSSPSRLKASRKQSLAGEWLWAHC